MKKRISWILCLIVLIIAAGCANTNPSGRKENNSSDVNDVLEAGMAEEESKSGEMSSANIDDGRQKGINPDAPEPEPVNEVEAEPVNEAEAEPVNEAEAEPVNDAEAETDDSVTDTDNSDGIDIDLTELSSTMVYTRVFNMVMAPENYVGRTVKMEGTFAMYHDEETDKNYYACIIADATACCSQGIEFILSDDYTYPDDYPEVGGDICVIGVFDTYQEGDITYCTLRDAKIL